MSCLKEKIVNNVLEKVFGRKIFLITAGFLATMPLYGDEKDDSSKQLVQSIGSGIPDIRIPSERERLIRWLSEFFSKCLCTLRNSSVPANGDNDPFALTDEDFKPFGYVLTRPVPKVITPLDLFEEILPFDKVDAESAYLFICKGLYGKVLVGNFAKRQEICDRLRKALKKYASVFCTRVKNLFKYSYIIAEREDDHEFRWRIRHQIGSLKFEKFGITRHEALYISPMFEESDLIKGGQGKFDCMFDGLFHLCTRKENPKIRKKLQEEVNVIYVFCMTVRYLGLDFLIRFVRLGRGYEELRLQSDLSFGHPPILFLYQKVELPYDRMDVLFKDD